MTAIHIDVPARAQKTPKGHHRKTAIALAALTGALLTGGTQAASASTTKGSGSAASDQAEQAELAHQTAIHHAEQRAQHRKELAARRAHAKVATATQISGELARQLTALRMCEASGNYRADTGNGFYGAYQFDLRTWRSIGLTGLPHQASKDVQDQAAATLHARRGWQPWPVCGRRL